MVVAEQFGNLRQDFQVLLCGSFGNQQEDEQLHSLFIRCIKPMGRASWKTAAMGVLRPLMRP